MSEQRPLPRNRLKSRTGCLRCKQRRVKCDETLPHCSQCTRRGFDCPGYKRPLKWSSKYEIGTSGTDARGTNPHSSSRIESISVIDVDALRIPSPFSIPWGSTASTQPDGSNLEDLSATGPDESLTISHFSTGQRQNNVSPEDEPNVDPTNDPLDMQLPEERLSHDLDDATNWVEWAQFPLPLSLPPPLGDGESGILRHYFVQVCRINSCFDSAVNFFRADIGDLMASSPLIYHCVLSMSAAHLAALKANLVATALDHRARALACLKSEMMRLKDGIESNSLTTVKTSEALLGSILLGMTDGWHNPSSLGTTHLHGARILFKRWMSSAQDDLIVPFTLDSSLRVRSFMAGFMAYWEAMASFLINQSVDATAYLNLVCDQKTPPKLHPNPWTGICTPLFVHLARVGTLVRQQSLLKQLSSVTSREDAADQLKADILRSARETETALLNYNIPTEEVIEDTADPLTPVQDLQRLAQVYRLAALLELYRNYPELLEGDAEETTGAEPAPAEKITSMAVSTLTLIAATPQTSGVNCLLTIPLIIAGSTLQWTPKRPVRRGSVKHAWSTLCGEIVAISSHADVQMYWRDFVRTRLEAVLRHVGIVAILRATEILDKVWTRSDAQTAIGCPGRGAESQQFVQWIEVMVEEKLETVLG
ncbi:hypothetical protein BO94DRAFT_582133 [Aspergillus sclerotioniger CBS 115572]|uniref:Zn(2)-C6 fungal-type domain-containing protein n=1 Tax=Aspergillus sclerotioniger CBS 115572 TaxID=1450535 RepID=A0A317X815_9EURO|nr:hypothetical protein BO94DRAFT_582133 [Aspergillus sclerotioniger CBS 115572]PWY94743.1 hypothetical protein BO94DRAFT_582133 [Aspergillus sclerotioniger CBS 115572]